MSTIAIVTDSNSGITQAQAEKLGVYVVPMPFYIDEKLYYEDINLTQEEFYAFLERGASVSTSQPSAGDIIDLWERLLKDYDEILYLPMSSGLSGTCSTAMALAADYDGRVVVVDNQRISVTLRSSVMDAMTLAQRGLSAGEIRDRLEAVKGESSIYIMVDTLTYLKKGGRITPAVAAVGTILKLKPVLQIQGEKLDSFVNARSTKLAKKAMIDAVRKDAMERFGSDEFARGLHLHMAYSGVNTAAIEQFRTEAMNAFPGHPEVDFHCDPLSLSVSCHIGPGAIAITCTKKLS